MFGRDQDRPSLAPSRRVALVRSERNAHNAVRVNRTGHARSTDRRARIHVHAAVGLDQLAKAHLVRTARACRRYELKESNIDLNQGTATIEADISYVDAAPIYQETVNDIIL